MMIDDDGGSLAAATTSSHLWLRRALNVCKVSHDASKRGAGTIMWTIWKIIMDREKWKNRKG